MLCKILAEQLDLVYVNVDQLIKNEMDLQTPIGLEIKGKLSQGKEKLDENTILFLINNSLKKNIGMLIRVTFLIFKFNNTLLII